MQAGAASLLDRADATGMVPARLAREKGHRFLAHYLETYQNKQTQKGRQASAQDLNSHGVPCHDLQKCQHKQVQKSRQASLPEMQSLMQ